MITDNRIVSFNGMDGCGKTTQMDYFIKEGCQKFFSCYTVKLSDKVEKLDKRSFHKWWFQVSSCNEFCDEIYSAISKTLSLVNKPAIIDKGLATFDARVWATLVIKGMNKREAYEMIQQKKKKFNLKVYENIRILLKSRKGSKSKVNDKQYVEKEKKIYFQYLKLQQDFLQWLERIGYFTHIISTDISISETNSQIVQALNWEKNEYQGHRDIIDIKSLGLPLEETCIISNILNTTKEEMVDELMAVLIGGSISRKQYISGWSDIDILILVNRYEQGIFEKLIKYIEENNKNVKVGITIFSNYEINNLLVDAKSLYTLYAYNSGRIQSLIYGEISEKCKITFEMLKTKNKAVIPESVHKLKRVLCSEMIRKQQKSTFKLVTLIVKVYLINHYNSFPTSYKSSMELMEYLTGINGLDVKGVTERNDFYGLEKYAAKLVDFLSNEQ